MNSFFLPIGKTAGQALPTILACLSCGAALPVSGLDILHISDGEPNPVLHALAEDLSADYPFFQSSFRYESFRPQLPSLADLSSVPAAASLIGALRGQGVPLSYRTDREAVEWAFSYGLEQADFLPPLSDWLNRASATLNNEIGVRVTLLCDLCDPFSAGAVTALLPWLRRRLPDERVTFYLLCIARRSAPPAPSEEDTLAGALKALEDQSLVARPDGGESSPAEACWLLSLPSALAQEADAWKIVYAAAARILGSICSGNKAPAPGLHTLDLPGILTPHVLGDQAHSFAAFVHCSVWLLSDLLPSLKAHIARAPRLRSLAPGARGSLFRRLCRPGEEHQDTVESVNALERALNAVWSEILSCIRAIPDPLRLPEVSTPFWQQAVNACGKAVTVASEYDVSAEEAEEAGVTGIKPVHRVSLADTAEERQLHRLEEIAVQLKEETEERVRVLSACHGCFAYPALYDCLRRCQSALSSAEQKLNQLSTAENEDRLNLAAAARRVRLLKAAVHRCEDDLSAPFVPSASDDLLPAFSAPLTPYSSSLLSPAAAEKMASLLLAGSDTLEPLCKDLRALLPSLFHEGQLSDGKTLLKELQTGISDNSARSPLSRLLDAACTVSAEEVAALRFHSAGSGLPSYPLLPDLYPDRSPVTVAALLPLLAQSIKTPIQLRNEQRGLLAMLLLRQYRRRNSDEATIIIEQTDRSASPVVSAWLRAHHAAQVSVISLRQGNKTLPFALLLPLIGLLPAHMTTAHREMIPAFAASWFDPEANAFTDPAGLLGEGDRTILTEQLSRLAKALPPDASSGLRAFLSDYLDDLSAAKNVSHLPDRMKLRLKAAFGLRMLPSFSGSLLRITGFYERFLDRDPIAGCLLGRDDFPACSCAVLDDVVFCYRNVPFARESSEILLQGIPMPEEDYILNLLEEECRILSRSSDDYHDALIQELSLLLERYPEARSDARQAVMDLLDEAARPVQDTVTELVWPWDPISPSVLTILTESLGADLAPFALNPFSDRLTIFPARAGEVLGDSLLSGLCMLAPRPGSDPQDSAEDSSSASLQSDAVLPPLSGALANALCRFPEGRTLVRPGFLSFDRLAESAVRVRMTLEGRFPVCLQRTYAPDELLNLYAHDIPTLSVWPNLPFAPEDWKAYFVYASLPDSLDIEVFTADGTSLIPEHGESSRTVSRAASFPLCFAFRREELSFGSMLNLLPTPDLRREGSVTACIDFGSSGTSVVMSQGRERKPLQGAVTVRTLIHNPAASKDLLRREFLPAVPVSGLLPTALRIFRNVPGAAPCPFEDGIVLMSSSLQDVLSIPSDALYTSLKWEEEKGRSVVLCLHQIMLMTALQARADGLASLLWCFAIPDEMAKSGREKLRGLFLDLAAQVNEAAGFPVPEDRPLVTFAAESAALGAYFRFCAAEDTRGGFMILDLGACTADIALFLRGREQAVRSCQLPLGVHYMLLPSLLRDPEMLRRDLGYVQDPLFLQDLSLLEQVIRSARADTSSLRHSRLALDSFIADRAGFLLPALLYHPGTGMPTRMGSLLLLHFSYLMMLSGLILLQISADPGKNDFLPEQMSLCLAGRGALLLEGLPDSVKTGLWHCLTMFRNPRVASLSLLFSSEKKMEIPVGLSLLQTVTPGLPDTSAVPAAISVRPEDLLPQFLIRFAKEFPASAAILFPNFLTGDFYHPFTPHGESLVTAAIEQAFTDRVAGKPYDALSAWISMLLDLVDVSSV